MALLFMDSFHHHGGSISDYASNQNKGYKVGTNALYTAAANDLRTGWRAFYANAGSRGLYWDIGNNPDASPPYATLYFGGAWKINSWGSENQAVFGLYDTVNGDWQCVLHIDQSGYLEVCRGAYNGTQLWISTNPEIIIDEWNYIEFQVTIHDTTGSFIVKKNGVQLCNETSKDTKNTIGTGADRIFFYGYGYFTDLYINTSEFYGPCRVDCLYPDGAGNYTQLTPSAGNNYECVDEPSDYNEDTDYVLGDAASEKDTYAFDNIPALSGSVIKGVGVNNVVRKDDVGVIKTKNMVRVNSTDFPETNERELTTEYRIEQTIWELNPDDTAAWEEADINAIEAGLEVTTFP